MMQLKHVAFCGGGSGGHIVPAIAIAEELIERNQSTSIVFCTSSRPVDAEIIQASELSSANITVVQQPLASSTSKPAYGWGLLKSTWQCWRTFRRRKPNVVLATGGFASIPGVLAGWWLGVPIALLEANTVVGRANLWLQRFARVIMTGWPLDETSTTALANAKHKAILKLTGVPMRRCFGPELSLPASQETHAESDVVRLLVLGGSLGADRLNELVLAALLECGELRDVLRIVHQTGQTNLESVRAGYDRCDMDAEVRPFIEDMAAETLRADVVISRAGAVSISEIANVGRASVLLPLSTAADDHQTINAEIFEKADATVLVRESDSDASSQLRDAILYLCLDEQPRLEMAAAAMTLVQPKAVESIADLLRECAVTNSP